MRINTNTYYYEHYSLLIICYLMYNLYFCILPIYIFMVCQSAEMADSKEDSEEQAKPSVINGHYDYVRRLSASIIHSFFAALTRISTESSKGVRGIVKGCPQICRKALAQSQSSKSSAESYCIPKIAEG